MTGSTATSLLAPPGRSAATLTSLTADACGGQDLERVRAAVVLASRGRWERFLAVFNLLSVDWRDVLMAGGLGNDDWPEVLNNELAQTGPGRMTQ